MYQKKNQKKATANYYDSFESFLLYMKKYKSRQKEIFKKSE